LSSKSPIENPYSTYKKKTCTLVYAKAPDLPFHMAVFQKFTIENK